MALGELVGNATNLQTLSVSQDRHTPADASKLAAVVSAFLCEKNKNLVSLALTNKWVTAYTVPILCAALPNLTNLRKLNLRGNSLNCTSLLRLCDALETLNLEELNLSNNAFQRDVETDVGNKAFGKFGTLLSKLKLTSFSFGGNGGISHARLKFVFDGLRENKKLSSVNLSSFVVRGNNDVRNELVAYLREHAPQFKHLYLTDN